MVKVEARVVIKRPVEEVFAFATTPHNAPQWQSGVVEGKQTSPGPLGVGTTLYFAGRFLGRRVTSRSVITAYEPPHKAAFKQLSGSFRSFVATLLCEPGEGGTRVIGVTEVDVGGLLKVGEPLIRRLLQRQIQGNFETLKDLLEGASSTS